MRNLKDSNSPAGMTLELHLQQHSWHSKSDTAKIKSALWEYLIVQIPTEAHSRPGDIMGTFLLLKLLKKMCASYFVKHDVLQSVLPWFICFGCGNNTQFPVYSLIFSQWRISLFLVIFGGGKKFLVHALIGQPLTDWVRGRLRSRSGTGCLIQSLFVPINFIVLWIQPFIPSDFKGFCACSRNYAVRFLNFGSVPFCNMPEFHHVKGEMTSWSGDIPAVLLWGIL